MDFFPTNHAVLTQRVPAVAQRLSTASPADGVEVLQSRTGDPVFRVRDMTLHSLYDPQGEARQWAALLPDATPACVVLGFGNGYHLEGLHAPSVLVVEPDLGLLRRALEVRDLTGVLRQVELLCPATAQQAMDQLVQRLGTQPVTVLVHQPSLRLQPAFFNELAERLEARRRLTEFRLKILLVYPIYGGSLPIAQYCSRALQALGHEVDVFDSSQWYGMYQFMQRVTDQEPHVRQLQGLVANVLAEAVVARALSWEPDLLFALAQAPLSESALARLRKFEIPTAFWFVEDFRVMPYWERVGPLYEHFFCVQQGELMRQLHAKGGASVHYLPMACAPDAHKPLPLTAEERQEYGSDVSFVGAGYYNRRNFFPGLLDFDLKIWGSDWEGCTPLKSVLQRGGARISTEDSVKIFNASPINLNLHSSTYHEGVNPHGDYVNPRTFELAGCGAFQLVDQRTLLPDLFKVGEEVVCFATLQEARQLIAYYLTHSAERQAIAAQSRARALQDHTYEQRMQAMLEIVFQRHHRRFAENRSAEHTAQHLSSKAGEDEDLRQLLGGFQPHERINLDSIVGRIRTGQGELSDAELTFLFMKEFQKSLTPLL